MSVQRKRISRIEALYTQYWNDVSAVVQELQQTIVNPWLERMGYYMLVGNGTYFIGYDDPDAIEGYIHITRDEMPQYVLNLMDIDIPGVNGDVGTLMWDYTPSVPRLELLEQRKQERLQKLEEAPLWDG